MSGALNFVASYQSNRPARCRHCGEILGYGEPALIDEAEPCLVVHTDCIRALLPERVEQLYIEIDATEPRRRSASSEFKSRIESLKSELDYLDRFAQGNMDELHPLFRPGRFRRSRQDL